MKNSPVLLLTFCYFCLWLQQIRYTA